MSKASSDSRRFSDGFLSASALAVLLLAVSAPNALARDAYVANLGAGDVSVINTQTNQVVGSPIKVGENPVLLSVWG